MRKKIKKSRFSAHGLPAFAWRRHMAGIIHDTLVAEYGGPETPRFLSHYAALVASCSEGATREHYEIVSGQLIVDLDGASLDPESWSELKPFGEPYVWVQRRHTPTALEIADLGTRHWRYYLHGQGLSWAHDGPPESFIWEWEHLVPRGILYRPDPELSEAARDELVEQRPRIMPLARAIMKEVKRLNPWQMR